MAVNRIQSNGTAPSPDRPDFNIAAGTGITVTASDDATNLVSKATVAVNGTLPSITVAAPGQVNLGQSTVTQITSITTGVTINASSGVITTVAATTAAASTSTFTVTNSACLSTSSIGLDINYAGTWGTNGFPSVQLGTVSAGSFQIVVCNSHSTNALNGVLKIHFSLS